MKKYFNRIFIILIYAIFFVTFTSNVKAFNNENETKEKYYVDIDDGNKVSSDIKDDNEKII